MQRTHPRPSDYLKKKSELQVTSEKTYSNMHNRRTSYTIFLIVLTEPLLGLFPPAIVGIGEVKLHLKKKKKNLASASLVAFQKLWHPSKHLTDKIINHNYLK